MQGRRSSLILSVLALVAALPVAPVEAAAPAPATIVADPRAAADAFFTDPRLAETRALIVVQDGRRVYERYAPGYGPGNRFISWSMAKSITSTLIGELVTDGKLELDAPAPVPTWHTTPGDPRGAITLRQLLHMSSGLKHSEEQPVESADTNIALFAGESGDIAGYAESRPLESKPGTVYEYSTLTSHILADIATRTIAPSARTPAERRAAMRAFITERLSGPAGMSSLLCEFDPQGTLLGGSFCHATARDWAAFGQLYLDNGLVAGRVVVDGDWVRFVRAPAPTNPGYGGHFWRNRPKPGAPALFPAQGPADAFAAIGHLGQYVIIVPSKRLVVVRLGKTQDPQLQPVRDQLGRLVNSFPTVSPP